MTFKWYHIVSKRHPNTIFDKILLTTCYLLVSRLLDQDCLVCITGRILSELKPEPPIGM